MALTRELPLTLFLLVLSLLQCCLAQQDFSVAPIPDPFQVRDMYPPRSEIDVCRPIQDHIDRSSPRFDSQLVTNTNPDINFATADSRIMSSRLQSRLNTLAGIYKARRNGRKMTVLKAWTPFPDPDLNGDDLSLHYEGRTVQIRLPRSGDYDDFLAYAVEARFDWVFFASSNLIRLSVIPTTCERSIDCVFILDQSGSVGASNHEIAKSFIANVVSFFSISPTQTKVGFVSYSTSSRIEFDLNEHSTLANVQAAVDDIPYRGGWTATALALEDARYLLNPANNFGARPDSDGLPKIAILITDGKSNQYPITTAAPALKNAGVQVYTIGVGNIDLNELKFISSDPDDEHVFLLNSFQDALGFVDFLSVTTCETQAIIQTCENTVSSVPQDILQFYQAQCNSFRSPVVVELTDIEGSSFLYCSVVSNNPGPLTASTDKDERTGVSRRRCEITLPSGADTVYVGVQGQAMTNTFSLVVMNQVLQQNQVTASVVEGDSYSFNLETLLIQAVSGLSWDFSIVEGNTGNAFEITSSNRFRFRNPASISFDTQPQYNVLVVARQSNAGCSCAHIRFQIDIIPNRVDFGPVRNEQVPEDAQIGRDVLTISATSGAGEISFSIVSGNTGNAFSIGSTSGLVEVASTLDFETLDSYTLTVRAGVTGTLVTDTVTFTITVTDVNESPFFVTQCAVNGLCSFSIDENEASGTVVGTTLADDPDLSTLPNGMLSYRISPVEAKFDVNSNGQIRTNEALDRETESSHSFEVIVSDSSVSISTSVVVTVRDLNDNAPVITGPSMESIDENTQAGFVLTQYEATDEDSGSNAEIEFSISVASGFLPFDVDLSNGLLTVTGAIDYESVQEYLVTVTATNPGSALSSSINTRILVNNLNDERPTFSGTFSASIDEHSQIGLSVTTVEATDADLGSHGVVEYSIIRGNFENSFQINRTSGEITIARDIDRESITMFELRVRATDLGTPQAQRRGTTVPIVVNDINDNAPMFNPASYSASLREDLSVNSDILTVFAFDNDEEGNPNSAILYSISSGNVGSVFSIDASSGLISLVQSLDFENTESYSLTILATDQGTPSMQGMATANITVLNVNEQPPTINGNQTIEISENAPIGFQVADFDAVDPDQMMISFEIRSGNGEGKFSIGMANGTITLIDSLDFETTPQYMLDVAVTDGEQTASSTLTVIVLDENEFPPVFDSPSNFDILEESPSGSLVGTVHATDMDGSAPNSLVTYAFAQQSTITDYFNLDATSGDITTIGVLDREELTQIFSPPESRQTVDIVGRDQGTPSMQSFVTVTITLLDINDNDPVFSDASYEASLLENLAPNQEVFQLSATDSDLGTNAEIRFQFELSNNQGSTVPFRVDEVNGLLDTTEALDCEQQPSYNFILYAFDLGSPRRNTSVPGVLSIIDENDNNPIFTMDPYTVPLSEATSVGTTVTTVMADDADKGLNGEIVYSVINEDIEVETGENEVDTAPMLRIDSASGDLILESEFNYERQQQVNVTVVAVDRGVPRRSGSAQVIFIIQNHDELPPSFPDLCEFNVPEDAALNVPIAQCAATDIDNIATSPDDVLVTYRIIGGNDDDMFRIDASTAEISLLKRFDRETSTSHQVSIEARDLSGQISIQFVRFFVSDVNDNTPQFTSAPYRYDFTVARIESQVQDLITISATDEDIGENGQISYSISNVARDDLRTVVEISARDGGSPARFAIAELVVNFERICLLQQYFIGESSGIVSAYVLCSVDISPPVLNITLGGSSTFSCTVLNNNRFTYQWIQNGSFITSLTFSVARQNEISYTVSGARFRDQGDYACKVSTSAGSLQSVTGTANIYVPPVITVPPQDQAVKEGEDSTFMCAAVGLPNPKIEWFRDTQMIHEGSTLVIASADSTKTGLYTCAATNSDDSTAATAFAKLTLFKPENVVELSLTEINNPSEDGSCHYIDYDAISSTIRDLTAQNTLITGVTGDNICEVTPCMPSPCQNGGTCSLSTTSLGGYECSCSSGFTGRDCRDDVEECTGSPCENEGTCRELVGTYECTCRNGTSGHRCQYMNTCATSTPCSQGLLCVDESGGGSMCVAQPDPVTSLVVTGLRQDPGFLSDFIQAYLERLLASSSTSGRRKRQAVAITLCEPRFVELSPDTYALIWLCLDGETPPSDEDQAVMCTELLESGNVDTCKPPNGEALMTTTAAPPPKTTAVVDIVLIKSTSSVPLDALVVISELERVGAGNELSKNTGAEVAKISAEVTGPRTPENGGTTPNNAAGVGAGITIGVIVAICIVVVIIVLLVVGILRYKDQLERQKRKRDHAMERALSLHSINAESNRQPPTERPLNTQNSTAVLIENETNDDYDELPPVSNGQPDFDDPVYTNQGAVQADNESSTL